ncbi:MAG: NmrA family NAD(P)-binding protein [Cyanobacteria bacterium CRU_2_1]|nr:NmrA family NAD(P)-binding protein [Cyanobacteria bacterium RU_5_0]NJR63952.1 NmrA family NAD(P)-binding protein [Cyanobacteria bacterium CRU_2_1]
MTKIDKTQPIVLVLGSTGQVGKLIVEALSHTQEVQVRVTSRRPEQVEVLRQQGQDAVYLDLDDPRTFAGALAGVDRLFLLTGYTVAMLVQSKTLIDVAKKAGVQHIVHLGIFGEWDCTDPHFAWHQMIERYIEASGMAWTHLHPNYFMENLLGIAPLKDGAFSMFCGDRRLGMVALKDVAAVAATILREGSTRFARKDYWMSTEALNGAEAAAILSAVLKQEIHCDYKQPEDLGALLMSGDIPVEPNYAEASVEFMQQVMDGRMGYIGSVRDDVQFVAGKPSTSFEKWAIENRDRLMPSK